MALVVNATAKSATANSYITVTEADTLAETFPTDIQDRWLGYSEDEKGRFLVTATRNIENAFRFIGARTTNAQALEWPRHLVPRDGHYSIGFPVDYLDKDVVPLFVREAVFLYAVELSKGDLTATDENASIKKLDVDGVIAIEYKDSIPATKGSIPNNVFEVLRKYGTMLSNLNSGTGMSTARLAR